MTYKKKDEKVIGWRITGIFSKNKRDQKGKLIRPEKEREVDGIKGNRKQEGMWGSSRTGGKMLKRSF